VFNQWGLLLFICVSNVRISNLVKIEFDLVIRIAYRCLSENSTLL
jgi:hypothetical protein